MKQAFNGTELEVIPTNDSKEWGMTIEQVAEGYGTSTDNIHRALQRHPDELREGVERGWTNSSTLGGVQEKVVIYKQGVIKLGFFIRSERAYGEKIRILIRRAREASHAQ